MATISNLVVNMIARTANFEFGMKRSSKALGAFQKSAAAISGTVRNIAAGILAAAGIGGFGMMVKSAMDSVDAMGKLSDVIGIATEDLAGLKYAADLSGASFEQLKTAIQYMLKNMKVKSGETTMEAFLRIADEIRNTEDAAMRMKTIMDTFGRGGAGIAPLLMEGSEGIRAMAEELKRMGGEFSRLDASKVEMANDAFTKIKYAINSITQTIAINLAPYITAISEYMVQFSNTGVEAAARVSESFSGILKVINAISIGFDILRGVLNGLASWMHILQSIWWGFATSVLGLLEDIAAYFNNDLAKSVESWAQRMQEFTREFDKGLADLARQEYADAGKNFADAFGDHLGDALKQTIDTMKYPEFKSLGIGEYSETKKQSRRDYQFQELTPNLVNVAALNPGQDPMLDLTRQQLQQGFQQISLLTRIANGSIS